MAAISEQDLIASYRECVGPLYRYVARRTGGNRSLSEDLVQETWLRALGAWRREGLPREPMAWLSKVASNLLASYYRQHKSHLNAKAKLVPGYEADTVQSPETAAVLHLALDRLRPRQARLIEAFHFDGKAIAEIANELGISEKAAEGRMRRAREALRAQLGAV